VLPGWLFAVLVIFSFSPFPSFFFFFFLFEMGLCYIAQTDLELLGSTSQVAGTVGTSHYAQLAMF
jgi:hypothetical protein